MMLMLTKTKTFQWWRKQALQIKMHRKLTHSSNPLIKMGINLKVIRMKFRNLPRCHPPRDNLLMKEILLCKYRLGISTIDPSSQSMIIPSKDSKTIRRIIAYSMRIQKTEHHSKTLSSPVRPRSTLLRVASVELKTIRIPE